MREGESLDPGLPKILLRKLSYLTVDWPLRQARLFPQVCPLIVEIGFGNGDFLLHLARKQADCNILGLEISSQSMAQAEAKIEKAGLKNARVIHSRAETALAHLLEPESVREFHINNPDPWFKKKHHRRRLISRRTVEYLTSRLEVGGMLHLATDIREYADMAHEFLAATAGLQNQFGAPWLHTVPGRPQTKYERKGYREGRQAHFFCYARDESPVAHLPLIKELDMPHLILQSPLDASQVVERFEATRVSAGGAHIAILRAYANTKRDEAVFEAVVEEPTIEQHVLIGMSPRKEAGQYIVKLTAVGHARATAGAHLAVAAVGEYVAGLDAGGRVLERRLRS